MKNLRQQNFLDRLPSCMSQQSNVVKASWLFPLDSEKVIYKTCARNNSRVSIRRNNYDSDGIWSTEIHSRGQGEAERMETLFVVVKGWVVELTQTSSVYMLEKFSGHFLDMTNVFLLDVFTCFFCGWTIFCWLEEKVSFLSTFRPSHRWKPQAWKFIWVLSHSDDIKKMC